MNRVTIRLKGDLEGVYRFPDTDIERAELEAFAAAVEGREKYPISHDEAIWGVEAFETIAFRTTLDRKGKRLSAANAAAKIRGASA